MTPGKYNARVLSCGQLATKSRTKVIIRLALSDAPVGGQIIEWQRSLTLPGEREKIDEAMRVCGWDGVGDYRVEPGMAVVAVFVDRLCSDGVQRCECRYINAPSRLSACGEVRS